VKNFLGIPVEGDITKSYRKSVPQRPIEEFGPILQKALVAPGLEAIRWRQYTPYFNDGDPCEFSIHGASFKFEDSAEDGGEYEDGFEDAWSLGYNKDPRFTQDLADVEAAVEGGAFYDVLLEAFGDHAEITVTKDKIDVEFYEHD
jgi:hypothetical protein